MYPPGSFANWSKQIVELLPALKDTFDKDKVLVTCLASLLELIRDEKLDPTQFLPYHSSLQTVSSCARLELLRPLLLLHTRSVAVKAAMTKMC